MKIINDDYTYEVTMRIWNDRTHEYYPDISSDIFGADILRDVDFDEVLNYMNDWKFYQGDFKNAECEACEKHMGHIREVNFTERETEDDLDELDDLINVKVIRIYNSDYSYEIRMRVWDGYTNIAFDLPSNIFNWDEFCNVDIGDVFELLSDWKYYAGDFYDPEQEAIDEANWYKRTYTVIKTPVKHAD